MRLPDRICTVSHPSRYRRSLCRSEGDDGQRHRQLPPARPQGRAAQPDLPDPANRRGARERRTREAGLSPGRRRSGAAAAAAGRKAQAGRRARRRRPSRCATSSPAAVIHEDRDLIVINKPAGVAVHGGSGVSFGVIEALRAVHPQLKELELVHRLDRETSGCLLVAKRRAVLRELHAPLREREMEKRYLALVAGAGRLAAKTIDLPLKTNLKQGGERVVRVHAEGQHAVTTFKPIAQFGEARDAARCRHRHGPHASDPRACRACRLSGRRRREVRRSREGREAEAVWTVSACSCTRASLTFRARRVEPFTVSAPLPPELQSVLDQLETAKRSRDGASRLRAA